MPRTTPREHWQAHPRWLAGQGFEVGFKLIVTQDEADGSFEATRLRRMAEYVRSQGGAA